MRNDLYGFDCLDYNIDYILRKCNCEDYSLMFIGSFQLFFNNIDEYKTIGKKIFPNRTNRFKDLYDIYEINSFQYINHNISDRLFWKIQPYHWKKQSFEQNIKYITESLHNNIPVSLEIDPYYLYWDRGYNKYHGVHGCVIESFDGKRFKIVDKWYHKEGMLDITQLREGFVRIIIFSFENERIGSRYNNELLGKMLSRIKNTKMLDSIYLMGNAMQRLDISKEFENCTPLTYYESTLDSRLLHICEQRLQVSYLFDYLDEIGVDFDMKNCAVMLRKSEVLWRTIKNELVKMFITKTYDRVSYLSMYFSQIYEIESKVVQAIKGVYIKNKEQEKRVDLHIHSNNSDGVYTPETVFTMAKDEKIDVISITDHNYINANDKLQEYSDKYGVESISGVEISSYKDGIAVHILAYDWKDTRAMEKYCKEIRRIEEKKYEEYVKLLEKDYSQISLIQYKEYVSSRKGGWKLLNYLLEKGICRDGFEYFELINSKGFNEYSFYPKSEDVIDFIHKCGGKAILAHPGSTYSSENDIEKKLREYVLMGIDGIECFHPLNSDIVEVKSINICLAFGLIITGGSDEHGNLTDRKLGCPIINDNDL